MDGFDGRIWRRRLHQLHDRDLPAVIIQLDGENVSKVQSVRSSQPIQARDVNFSVVVADKIFEKTERGEEGEELEDRLLDHIEKIEVAMLDGQKLEGRLIHELGLNSIEIQETQENDRPLGYARLSFTMSLRTRSGNPANPI
ncbi:hypothetical protein GLP52_18895 [Sulfitobacter sp. M22]|nr:hypothetical protein [Sulfitobacter sp. M22]